MPTPMFLGIEIGGTKLQLVIGDEGGRILVRRKLTVERSQGAEGIQRQIKQEVVALLREHRVKAIGVGFGGPVDWRSGRIARSHQIEGWSGFDLTGWLQLIADLPVYVDNDANLAALGEAVHGAGIEFNSVFYTTLGSGVGGGLIVGGQIYHGATPGECEIGHLRLDREGGILESRCSGWAIDARIRSLSLIRTAPAGERLGGEARLLAGALAQGDTAAEEILKELAGDLAFGLSHVTHLLHPELIILGGGLSHLSEPLRCGVEQALPSFLMETFRPGPRLALAVLQEDAVPVGALELARTKSLLEKARIPGEGSH